MGHWLATDGLCHVSPQVHPEGKYVVDLDKAIEMSEVNFETFTVPPHICYSTTFFIVPGMHQKNISCVGQPSIPP